MLLSLKKSTHLIPKFKLSKSLPSQIVSTSLSTSEIDENNNDEDDVNNLSDWYEWVNDSEMSNLNSNSRSAGSIPPPPPPPKTTDSRPESFEEPFLDSKFDDEIDKMFEFQNDIKKDTFIQKNFSTNHISYLNIKNAISGTIINRNEQSFENTNQEKVNERMFEDNFEKATGKALFPNKPNEQISTLPPITIPKREIKPIQKENTKPSINNKLFTIKYIIRK